MAQNSAVPSYKDLLDDASKLLFDASDTPRIDAEILLQHVISKPMAWLIAHGDSLATANHIKNFYAAISDRQTGKPIAYITGSREFWTLNLKVNESVLIPRPDTETLVEHALQHIPSDSHGQLLDLGTGSGAIALALAKERPDCDVYAIDSQPAALQIAQENAELNGIKNISFVRSNWFDDVAKTPKFNLIASNPPYVQPGDPHLLEGDLRFEPDSALTATENGLSDLRQIITAAPEYLAAQGWLIVEHGYNQEIEVAEIFTQIGYSQIRCFHDINGLPRCTIGQHTAN